MELKIERALLDSANPLIKPRCTAVWPRSVAEFEALVDMFQHELVRFAFCRLRSAADAEDVVQDVLLRTYQDRDKHRNVTAVGPYLYRMVANRCSDVRRGKKRTEPIETADATPGRPDADLCRLVDIEALFSALPGRQAEVMRLRVYSELPFESIAEVVGASVPTIKSRFRYAVRKLRNVLSR